MAAVTMQVKLIAHTQLSDELVESLEQYNDFLEYAGNPIYQYDVNERAAVALTAIRTCYSPGLPSEVLANEAEKYFGSASTDGEGGTDADRLFRHITRSGHTSTLEHINYTFAIEGVSRSLLAQLTRHRQLSFSVQSQRYVKFGSNDKSGGFDYVVPHSIENNYEANRIFEFAINQLQAVYDDLRTAGVPAEDARFVLPNAAACNLVMTCNLRALLEFYTKRKKGNGAQWEIAELAEKLRVAVVRVDPWVAAYFTA